MNKKNNKQKKNSNLMVVILGILIIVTAAVLGYLYYANNQKEKEEDKDIGYTQLLEDIENGLIENIEMTVGSTTLKVTYKDREEEKDKEKVIIPNTQAFIELLHEKTEQGKEIAEKYGFEKLYIKIFSALSLIKLKKSLSSYISISLFPISLLFLNKLFKSSIIRLYSSIFSIFFTSHYLYHNFIIKSTYLSFFTLIFH